MRASSIIESVDDAAQARIRECAPAAVEHFRNSVRPIYRLRPSDRRLEHIGSCILLDIDGTRVVSTAAHIADDLAQTPHFVLGLVGTHPVLIPGGVRATAAPSGNRDADRFDCAYWQITDEAAAALGAVVFVDGSRRSHNRAPSPGRTYTACGYPVSRNKKRVDNTRREISTGMSMYTAHLIDDSAELAAKLPHGGEGHLLLNFARQAQTTDGQVVNVFGPIGLSGGALLDLGDFISPATYVPGSLPKPLLSGMLIRHWKEGSAIVAVKIDLIVDAIKRSLARRRPP